MFTITVIIIALGVGFGLVAASLALALTSCGTSNAPSPTEDAESYGGGETAETRGETHPLWNEGTEAPVPGKITRIRLAEGLTIRDVDMVRPEGIEYILGMLDVDTYELVDPEHERAVAVLDEASVVLEFYAGDELCGMAWVTDPCEVVVIIEGGGVWYTQTPAVDTVLITAEFGREP